MKLGWKGKGTQFDLLPLVLQANGHDPDYFDLPPELVLQVQFSHPEWVREFLFLVYRSIEIIFYSKNSFPWFESMGLKWYCVPGVANMLFDCGGLQFPACPFNGWYMSSEIGRDLCDAQRYNILEVGVYFLHYAFTAPSSRIIVPYPLTYPWKSIRWYPSVWMFLTKILVYVYSE